MTPQAFSLHGPDEPRVALVLDSPHSGVDFPSDFDAVVSEYDLRDGEDCFVDEFGNLPAIELGISLLAARYPRTYLDPNRHHGDIDRELIEGGSWPHEYLPSGKAAIGKALIWRTLDDRAFDLLAQVAGRRGAFAHRSLPCTLPPGPVATAGDGTCGVWRGVSPQLPFDELRRRQDG